MLLRGKYTHEEFYVKLKGIYEDELDVKSIEDEIETKMRRNIKNRIYDNNVEMIIQILFEKFASDYIKTKSIVKISNKVNMHNNRVLEHLKIILFYANEYGRKTFTEQELYIMYTACIFHDIGKIYRDDKYHPIYSYLITKYILDMNDNIDDETKDIILEIVLMHGNKREFQKEISEYTAYVRDADLFDENCGFSLFTMLNDMVMICKRNKDFIKYDEYDKKYLKDINLNKPDFEMSDDLLKYKTSTEFVTDLKSKISISWNHELYDKEINRVINDYNTLKFGYKVNLTGIYSRLDKYTSSYKIDIN